MTKHEVRWMPPWQPIQTIIGLPDAMGVFMNGRCYDLAEMGKVSFRARYRTWLRSQAAWDAGLNCPVNGHMNKHRLRMKWKGKSQ